jgi:enoyl-CoA hydratase/carnithine racemase
MLEKARVVILQADGKMFTAGLDLKEMASLFSPGESEGKHWFI